MGERRRRILGVLLIFLLVIVSVPIVGTESSLALGGSSGANLTGVIHDDEGVDADGDGFFDYLKVGVQVNVTESGIYRVSISRLRSSNASYISIYKDKSMYLDVGLQVVNVSLHGPTIYLSGLNPVNVSSIYLYDKNGNQLSYVYDVPLSREYSYIEFDAPGASLTGVIFDSGKDTDGDSLFDFLEVGVQVNVTEPGIYSVHLSWLRDANFSYMYVWGFKSEYLDVGLQVLNLSLNGPTIYASGLNPRFVNYISLSDEKYSIGSLSDIPLSREYQYTEFDAPPPIGASLTGEITDRGVDSDGDSKFDYLEVGVQINVTIANTYRVGVSNLRDAYWNYTSVWGSVSSYLDVGEHLLNVTLFGPTIHAYGFNPEFVSYISLRDENDTYLDSRNNVPLSRVYLYTEFDVPGAVLTGVVSDRGVDTDSDGAFNYLEVSVEINVTEPGVYRLSLSDLKDTEMNHISVWDYESAYFSEGIHWVNMSLEGSTIYSSGRNSRFVSYISLRDENDNHLGRLENVLLSREYMYNEFESPTATLTGMIVDEGVDSDGDGSFDYLKVGVEINVTEAGEYRLSVSGLLDAEMNHIDVYDSKSIYLDGGLQLVNASLWGPAIYISGLDPRLVSWIDLSDENWNSLDRASNIPLSREYLHTEFDAPGAYLTGVISDKGIDSDGDGLFNYFEVGVQVNVTEAGFYRVSVSDLEDIHSLHIGIYNSQYLYLMDGVHTVNLTLQGLQIYMSGLNPAFVSYIYLEDESYRNIGSLSRVALSREYSYTEFDPPKAVLTGKIYDRGVDTDGDGAFNYLEVGVEINVSDSGNYRVEVSGLQDSSLNNIDVRDSASGYFDPGTHVLNVSLYGPAIHGSGLNPSYVSSIYLYDDYYSYLYNVPLSQEYLYTDFDPPGATLTRVSSDYGDDTDGDGQFNYLRLEVEINVTEAGNYGIYMSGLLDSSLNRLDVYDSTWTYLDKGVQVVYLSVDGLRIHMAGFNPRYIDYVSLRDEKDHYLGGLDDALLSREYSYEEFEAPGATFTKVIYDQGVDTDGDGAFNYLQVGVELNVTDAGTYEVYVNGLRDTFGNWIDVYGSAREYLEVGTHVLNVSLSGLTIYLSERNPSYISYASLRDQNYNQLDELSDMPLSREYSYSEFEPPGAVLTGVIFDQGVDTDSDGTYDYLQIGVEVDVTDPGNYHVSVDRLLDSSFNEIYVYDSNFTFLDAGLQIVYLYLKGPRIYLSGRNPRYIDHISLRDEEYTYHDYLNRVSLSREYSYTEFDPPAAMLTGKIYDHGVDTDGDGAFNYLEVGVEINVTEAGTYEVYVDGLRDLYGNWISVYGSAREYLEVGTHVLNVSLYGPRIYASRVNPRYVNYISLRADSYSSLHDVPLSREYLYTEFDFPAILTGVIFDQGVDTDADGSFDYLEISVQVNVSDSGTYVLSVSGLRDTYSNYISVRDSKTIYLNAGIQTVNLYLYGPQIYVTRRNPVEVSYIYLSEKQYTDYYYHRYYDSISDVPLSREYSYTEFDAPFVDVETKFIVHPDGRVAVEGVLNYTNMVPENTPRYTTAQGFFNLTGDELSSQASAGLTLNLPAEIASEFPFNSTTAELLAQYSNGILDLGVNSTMILPSIAESIYPYNATDGTLTVTYSGGILNIEVEGNTTLPQGLASKQFPFNNTDITVVGTYSPNMLDGTITFSVLDEFTFDDVNVDFTGNQTDLTLTGTVHVLFNVPLDDFIIHNETELIQMIDELKRDLPGKVRNMTDGLLNVTNLDINYVLNGMGGASVTFRMDVHGDFVRALAYLMSGGRNEMLLYPALNEACQSVQSGSFDIRYNHTTRKASTNLTFSYDLKPLIDYILTPPTGTTPYIMFSYSMSPTLWIGDVVMVEEVSNASDIIADPKDGDIIAYYYPNDQRYVVIHRAVNKTYMKGTWYFTTQGDAYGSPDSWLVPENLVIGKAVRRIPLLGYLVAYPYFSYPYYYYPYPHATTEARLALLKAICDSVESTSIQLSYSSIDRRFDFKLTQVDKLETLIEESALILPEILPPETPPEIRSFVESLLNTTYASVDSATISFTYKKGKADFEAAAAIKGDISAEANYVKDLYFQLIGAQYNRYNMTIPWQLDFINQTKVDISNFEISAKLGETSFEGRIKGLTLMPPKDALNSTHFKLERFFNLTAPQYSWQQEFPGEHQKLKITIEGGSNATHGVTLFRDPQTVPEPDETASHQMIWYNQTLSSLKDLVFNIRELGQYDLGWIVGKVVDADSSLPIVGATITAGSLTTTTDVNGCYVISNVAPGDYTVTISAAGYRTKSKSTHLYSGVTTTVNFKETLVGVIDGTVTDASTGLPISGASITLDGYTTTTNAGGYYKIDVPHGDYTVTASATEYLSDSKSVHVVLGETTTVDFALSPAGTLTVSTTPVAGEVFVNGTSWGVANISVTVAVGTYNVSFGDVSGYRTPAWQIADVQKGIETTVIGVYEPILGAIDGMVTDASTGLPIAGATVTADGYSAITDSSGYYIITDVLVETYTVTAEATGYYSDTKTSIVVEPGVTTVNFTLSLIVGWIDGYVTDIEGGAAIVGATVAANTVSTTTDTVGYYKIELIPGDYTVTVSASGYGDRSKTATVTAGDTTIVNFALAVLGVVVEEITEPELVNAINPFIVNATEEAATSLIITEISDPITIVVQNVTERPEDVDPPPGTWEVLGNYVQITVNNTDITVNATIRMYYTLEQLEASGLDESTLEIRFWNATSGEWEPFESHVNTEEHYVWAIIDHFSLFAIMGVPSEAPFPTQLWFLAIASIVIIVVTLVSVIFIRRRKKAITPSSQRP